MVREIVVSQCGIIFDEIALARNDIKLDDASLHVMTSEQTGPQELKPDKDDAVQPLHDQLKRKPLWWILEIVPTQYSFQNMEGTWLSGWG